MKRTALYKRVRKAIENDLIENDVKWFATYRYIRNRGAYFKNTRNMPIECSYSTVMRALEDMVKDGLVKRFGNAHTVTTYIYLPNLKKWALELENES